MPLLFNMLSRLVIAFPPRSKCLLISWVQSPSAVILEPKKMKSVTVSIFSPSIDLQWADGLDAMILVFWMLNFRPALSLSSFTFIKMLFSSSSLLPQGWCHLHICSLPHSIVFLYFFAWSLRKAFLSLLAILWNSSFRWVYLAFSPLPWVSLLFSVICILMLTSMLKTVLDEI